MMLKKIKANGNNFLDHSSVLKSKKKYWDFSFFGLRLTIWSRGRVDRLLSEGPRFNLHVSQKLFTKSHMNVVG